MRGIHPGTVFVVISLACVESAHASTQLASLVPAAPPPGHSRAISPLRVDHPPVIDGRLDDEAWKAAPVADHFWIPSWQQPPREPTEVRVAYDDRALYVAFTCFDSMPAAIRANAIVRDRAPHLDDHVSVDLDPFHNHRLVSQFSVTARGTQHDAMAGGRAAKTKWKGEWRSAVQRTALGWTVEIAIPFAILDFDRRATNFGVNFSRYHSRTEETSYWADLSPRMLPEEAGHLVALDLAGQQAPNRLTAMQYAAGGISRSSDADALPRKEAATGVDIRYNWRGQLNAVVAVNPDDSQLDREVLGVGFDYNEKWRGEHRPFFREGAAFFGDASIFHSARIDNVDVGVKAFGRVGSTQMGALMVTDATHGRRDFVARVLRELGPTFSTGLTLVGTGRADLTNHVARFDARGRIGGRVTVDADVAGSWTAGRAAGNGARMRGGAGYIGTYWQAGAAVDRTDVTFLAADGIMPGDVTGTSGVGGFASYNRAFARGSLKRLDASVSFDRRTTTDGLLQRQATSAYVDAKTRDNLQISAGITVGPYRPRGSAAGQWLDVLYDDRFYTASAYYHSPGARVGYGTTYSWGRLGGTEYRNLAPSFHVVPHPQVTVAYSLERAVHYQARHQSVLSGTWDITPTQGLSARWVAYEGSEYRLSYRRVVSRGMDMFAVYSDDAYTESSLNVKLVWTLLPFDLR